MMLSDRPCIIKKSNSEMLDKKSLTIILDSFRSKLGYDFTISSIEYDWFVDNIYEKQKKLGQVFTPIHIAQLIANLCIDSENDHVLDPCFGEGVFLNAAFATLRGISNLHPEQILSRLNGVEIDPTLFVRGMLNILYTNNLCFNVPKNFFNGNIFDLCNGVFDAIIFNPPYVRQEHLVGPEFLDKIKISEKVLKNHNIKLPGRSNLYSYFIIFLTNFLKIGGRMGMIISNAWLDSDFGKYLRKFILNNYDIEYIIDFDRDSFKDVSVETCVLILRRRGEGIVNNSMVKFVSVKKKIPINDIRKIIETEYDYESEDIRVYSVSPSKLIDNPWRKYWYFDDEISKIFSSHLIHLSKLADVSRGLTTNLNDFYMLKDIDIINFEIESDFVYPIISRPRDLKSYSTSDAKISKVLVVNRSIDELKQKGFNGIIRYTEEWMSRNPSKFEKNDLFFNLKKLHPSSLIFSYIIRKTKAFILNPCEIPVRDNFYCIKSNYCDPLLLFGILNSTLTKIFLELSGRRYGDGLLKLQVYELGNLLIPDPRWMDQRTKDTITNHSSRLAKISLNDKKSINTEISIIDSAICEHIGENISPERLIEIESRLTNRRISKVGN